MELANILRNDDKQNIYSCFSNDRNVGNFINVIQNLVGISRRANAVNEMNINT